MIRIFMAALILAGAVTRVGAQSSPPSYRNGHGCVVRSDGAPAGCRGKCGLAGIPDQDCTEADKGPIATWFDRTGQVPLIADVPQVRTWSSILVYSDKTYDLKEHIESEHACRESLCYVQWQVGCDEHQEKLKADKRKAELEEIERQKQQLIYMQNHPCKVEADGSKRCQTSDTSWVYYDKDGKWTGSAASGSMMSSFNGGPSRSIQVAACFQ